MNNNSPAAKKAPPFLALTFGVHGQAKLDAIVRMLEEFHRTRLKHKIRNVAVQKPKKGEKGDLEVNLTIEALQVTGAEARDTLLPSSPTLKPRVLAEPGRRYAAVAERNMFLGIPAAPSRLTEDRAEVLGVVKLTTLAHNGRRWEAYLYDQGKGGSEKMLTSTTITDFEVRDKYDSVLFEGTVVHLDSQQMVFRSEGKFYRLHCGECLYPAVENPLSDSEVKALGLTPSAP
jgi:hypothetical protein